MSAIAIRQIYRSDKPEWAALWKAYLEFYETSLPDEIYNATFERLLSDSHPDQNGFLAIMDNTPVGLVHYIYHAHNWNLGKVCYLQDLYAKPQARGMGAGRKLIEAVYAAADQAECPSVYWLTQDFNHAARKLYDKMATLTPFIKYSRS
ncbi:MAG: GNAT family N-acetyltransferase [Roseovarius sp.]|nr:GNAT family N-acetyltransferase [Roseovarius sp.]MCY4208906.1 GNAT family N-acetyltransferase [Roseovarius sp.]MCY4292035.1 GNAT family N-acetyltransferase [Roseovarius sp.]MCY4317432.1 GNAT family N-acetyltransferase [Roseovarius sp.]